MTSPLDEKGLTTAAETLERLWRMNASHTDETWKHVAGDVVRAYLSTTALPDGMEVIGFAYRDKWRDDLRWSLAQSQPSAIRNRIIEPVVRASQAQSALATMRVEYVAFEKSVREREDNFARLIGKQESRAKSAEAQVKRLTEDNEALRADAARYRYLRDRDLDTIHNGGVFAGSTPENVVLNGADLDQSIDDAMAKAGGLNAPS